MSEFIAEIIYYVLLQINLILLNKKCYVLTHIKVFELYVVNMMINSEYITEITLYFRL